MDNWDFDDGIIGDSKRNLDKEIHIKTWHIIIFVTVIFILITIFIAIPDYKECIKTFSHFYCLTTK